MSVSGDFGPAPPGLDLSENQNGDMLGGVITLMVLGTLSVLLRIYARLVTKDFSFALDDYLIFAALVSVVLVCIPSCGLLYGNARSSAMALVYALLSVGEPPLTFFSSSCHSLTLSRLITGINYGNGHHIQTLTYHDFTVVWKLLFSHVIIYATCVTCTKTSIMLFYRRIFNLRLSLYVMLFLILGYYVAVFITIFAACSPISYFWRQYTDRTAPGTCINTPKFFLGNGIAAVTIDVFILCVPMPTLWKLQMPKSQKAAIMGILLLGGL